ncbi:unnamed protein product [marine sediment metagenome]|uniref:Uncharacterized protein n=1 Tax=marine sediment metagenome TaxID=412755 RepID=X1BF84_9ZZZZ
MTRLVLNEEKFPTGEGEKFSLQFFNHEIIFFSIEELVITIHFSRPYSYSSNFEEGVSLRNSDTACFSECDSIDSNLFCITLDNEDPYYRT